MTDGFAIIGMAARLPRANGPAEFWRLLRSGTDAVTDPPPGRPAARRGAFLDDITGFDAGFFGIFPREAAAMDPHQRLMLELGWEALEHGRLTADRLAGTQTGVFVCAPGEVAPASAPDHYTFAGRQRGMVANRLSYALGLHGPSLTVDTGQSSSLVAVHLAVQSLRTGECDLAIAGGVSLMAAPDTHSGLAELGVLSPDGRCYVFDSRANGFVRGEGGGLVVLKRLADALADGDRIAGVILGSAVNNDGRSPNGLTAPSAEAQQALLARAYGQAGVDPGAVQYVELHGTGTAVGDPVEAGALGAALGTAATRTAPLLVGSVKTNIGHLEAAAGIAGLLKTVLSLQNRQVPASLHFEAPNPAIALGGVEPSGEHASAAVARRPGRGRRQFVRPGRHELPRGARRGTGGSYARPRRRACRSCRGCCRRRPGTPCAGRPGGCWTRPPSPTRWTSGSRWRPPARRSRSARSCSAATDANSMPDCGSWPTAPSRRRSGRRSSGRPRNRCRRWPPSSWPAARWTGPPCSTASVPARWICPPTRSTGRPRTPAGRPVRRAPATTTSSASSGPRSPPSWATTTPTPCRASAVSRTSASTRSAASNWPSGCRWRSAGRSRRPRSSTIRRRPRSPRTWPSRPSTTRPGRRPAGPRPVGRRPPAAGPYHAPHRRRSDRDRGHRLPVSRRRRLGGRPVGRSRPADVM